MAAACRPREQTLAVRRDPRLDAGAAAAAVADESALTIWLVAQNIANQPYDRELGEMARTLARQVAVERGASRTA